jgi:hypothetical protein
VYMCHFTVFRKLQTQKGLEYQFLKS